MNAMNTLPLVLGLAAVAASSLLAADSPRSRESFDVGWMFGRFGAMPDGSYRDEPGAPAKMVRASSEEAAKGNTADKAVDGDRATRWCASGEGGGQWLVLDLGRAGRVGAVEIEWEQEAVYPFKLEASPDGTRWQVVADRMQDTSTTGRAQVPADVQARYVRVTVGSGRPGQWASIRELRVLDPAGRPVKPVAPGAGPAPVAPQDPAFDDSAWRALDLPHDWGIEGPFRADLPNETGKLPWYGIGWYRKAFTLPATDKGRSLFLDFDGAMSQAQVWVNGTKAGEWMYGYNSFRIDLTPHLRFGETNTVAVRLDNPPDSSRWYPGGGIYRHTWLVKTSPVHIAHWGVFVRTPQVAEAAATVAVTTTTEGGPANGVTHEVLDGNAVVAEGKAVASGTGKWEAKLEVKDPKRWEVGSPHLYTLRTRVLAGGQLADELLTPFGVRTAEWVADKGFVLNGRVVKINGVCNHHDLGALGAAVHARALQRQLEILREMGCNAVRTSHNPPAPELLDLCDRMGFLVMDELFDMWKSAKKGNDYHRHFDAWHERDAIALIHRDRNHPCVVLWSTGNEVPEQGGAAGRAISKMLTDIFHREDPTRLVAAGCNNHAAAYNGFADTIDVMGFNYPPRQEKLYQDFRQRRPRQPVFGSETSSCVSSRGIYFFPVDWNKAKGFFQFQVSSYDLYAPGWANRPDLDFAQLDQAPAVAGEFVWTGFDYLGEPTPYNQDESNALNFQNEAERREAMEVLRQLGGKAPSRSSYFGIIDLAGFPKDRYYLYQARWRPDHPMVHLLPHWNWPDRNGQVTPVHAYTSGDEAELFLNGKSLGRKKKDPLAYRIVWDDVKYEPGEIKVAAYKQGKPWATGSRRTTGPAAGLKAVADRAALAGDGQDLSYVTVEVVDARGEVVPTATPEVRFQIAGPAEIVATDNGDATDHAVFASPARRAFSGKCLAIVRARRGGAGEAVLTATSPGLPPARIPLRVGGS